LLTNICVVHEEKINNMQSVVSSERHYGTILKSVLVQLSKLIILSAFVIILFMRMPDVRHGRFWAEEGKVFFASAAALPWWSALLRPYGGYLNIVVNAASVVAFHTVPLEDAPFVTTSIGLTFQCCPAIILLYSRDAWLKSPWTVIAALLIIATPPFVSEVWLQSLHSQFHLALCCAIILALDISTLPMTWFTGIILFLAPLCGPAAAALLPLFLARAALDRSWPRFFQALTLAIATIIQFAFFYSHQAGRVYHINPLILICDVYVRQILSPLGGWELANMAAVSIQARLANHLVPWVPIIATSVTAIAFAIALWRRGVAAFIWLFLGAGLITLACYFGAFDTGMTLLLPGNEGRYIFIQQVLLGLTLVGIATGTRTPDCWIARVLVAWLIIVGVMSLCDNPSIHGPAFTDGWIVRGPNWHHEVALWRLNPTQPLSVWPSWPMTLPPPRK
jgi:hypothetical protein